MTTTDEKERKLSEDINRFIAEKTGIWLREEKETCQGCVNAIPPDFTEPYWSALLEDWAWDKNYRIVSEFGVVKVVHIYVGEEGTSEKLIRRIAVRDAIAKALGWEGVSNMERGIS